MYGSRRPSTQSPARFAVIAAVAALLCAVPPALAEEPDRWEPAIQAFEAQDRESMPPEGATLFVGSSSILLWDLDESFPDLVTVNRGFGGSTIADVNLYVERIVIPYKPAAIVFYAGDNDVDRGATAEQVLEDFKAFVAKVKPALPDTKVLFISIKPSVARWELWGEMNKANGSIEKYCAEDEDLTYVDLGKTILGEDGKPRSDLLMKDGLHLNEEGYARWNDALRPYLANAMKKESAAVERSTE